MDPHDDDAPRPRVPYNHDIHHRVEVNVAGLARVNEIYGARPQQWTVTARVDAAGGLPGIVGCVAFEFQHGSLCLNVRFGDVDLARSAEWRTLLGPQLAETPPKIITFGSDETAYIEAKNGELHFVVDSPCDDGNEGSSAAVRAPTEACRAAIEHVAARVAEIRGEAMPKAPDSGPCKVRSTR